MLSKLALFAAALAPLASALPQQQQYDDGMWHPSSSSSSVFPGPTAVSDPKQTTPKKGPVNKQEGSNRVAIYWGAEDYDVTLDNVCNDPSYDIVNLAFLAYFFKDGGYPTLTLGQLQGPSQAQQAAGATGLKDATSLASAVKSCQDQGKLVILSLGGANDFADVTLKNDEDGKKVADKLWNLFLGGTDKPELRPFGADIKLDGLDLDNERPDSTGYDAFIKQLRANFAQDVSKKYYLTAAPQCPFPDQSVPLDICAQLDYVWVQFYNNGECNVAQPGFKNAVQKWSEGIGQAQLFIGAIASDKDGDEGYVPIETMVSSIQDVKALGLHNLGGAMLWEAQLAKDNGDYGKAVKGAL